MSDCGIVVVVSDGGVVIFREGLLGQLHRFGKNNTANACSTCIKCN